KVAKVDAVIKETVDMYKEIIADKETQELLWAQEKYRLDHLSAVGYAADVAEQRGIQIGEQRGIQIGEQRGMQIGEQRGKLEIARALLSEGAPISMIAKCTGFRISELEELKK
ncbi:MAG: hypothetical protein LBQ43_05290, partial [Holosporales bacterium]|nr:hypothetical protein [Holosporales bacterium]